MDKSNEIRLIEIDDNLWLGNYKAAQNTQVLKEKGISKVLTVMNEIKIDYNNEKSFTHKTLDVMDIDYENIIQYFGECLNFIKGEEKTLVHCAGGISRSPTIVIAYLMWSKKINYNEANKLVKMKKNNIRPNSGFIKQLKIFQNILLDNDYDIDKINFKEIKWVPRIFK